MRWRIGLLSLLMITLLTPVHAQMHELLPQTNVKTAPRHEQMGDREYNAIMRETDYKCRIRWTPWGWQRTCVDFWGSRWW